VTYKAKREACQRKFLRSLLAILIDLNSVDSRLTARPDTKRCISKWRWRWRRCSHTDVTSADGAEVRLIASLISISA